MAVIHSLYLKVTITISKNVLFRFIFTKLNSQTEVYTGCPVNDVTYFMSSCCLRSKQIKKIKFLIKSPQYNFASLESNGPKNFFV